MPPVSGSHLSQSVPQPQYILKNRSSAITTKTPLGRVSQDYIDTYNQIMMNQYNNDYNYAKSLEEREYNSPAAQVARLKAAGLNPNYNSIDGTGNVSLAGSDGKITGNSAQARNARLANDINAFNAVMSGLQKGVESYSALANTPSLADLSGYRDALAHIMDKNKQSSDYKLLDSIVKHAWNAYYYGGSVDPYLGEFWHKDQGGKVSGEFKTYDVPNSPGAVLTNLLKNLRSGQVNLNEKQLEKAEAYINSLNASTSAQEFQNSIQEVNTGVKWLDTLLKFLGPILVGFIRNK